ncbi:MAG: PilZ domain-containing protein [Planctomycetota bacterium]
MRRRRRDEDAQEFADCAALLLEELKLVEHPFEGAPLPFHKLILRDAADPESADIEAWVQAVDERNLTLVCRSDCPWPMRHELLISPCDEGGEPFRAALLLRPVPPRYEWVVAHDLVDVITNRRSSVRVPCEIATNLLPDNGDTVLMRERLADQETLTIHDLQRRKAWAQRRSAVLHDVSPEGCRMELSHDVALRDRFHLVLARLDGELVALPLCEVVDLQRGTAGAVQVGVRFIGLRLHERSRLAEFVRELVSVSAASS